MTIRFRTINISCVIPYLHFFGSLNQALLGTLTLGNSYNNINMYSFSTCKYVRYHEVLKGRKIIIFAIPDIAKCRVCIHIYHHRVLLKHRKENGKGLHFIIFNKILFVQRITIYKTINFHLYIIGAFSK